jgi:hypothetical protein
MPSHGVRRETASPRYQATPLFSHLVQYFSNNSSIATAVSAIYPVFLGIFSLFTLLVPVLLVIAAGGKASL